MSSPCCFHGCCNQKFCAHRDGLRSEDVGDDDDCGCADDDDCVGDDDDCGGADDGDGGDGSGEHDKEVDGGDDDVGDKNDHAFGFWLLVTFAGRRSVISMSSNLWVSTSFWWIAIRSS